MRLWAALAVGHGHPEGVGTMSTPFRRSEKRREKRGNENRIISDSGTQGPPKLKVKSKLREETDAPMLPTKPQAFGMVAGSSLGAACGMLPALFTFGGGPKKHVPRRSWRGKSAVSAKEVLPGAPPCSPSGKETESAFSTFWEGEHRTSRTMGARISGLSISIHAPDKHTPCSLGEKHSTGSVEGVLLQSAYRRILISSFLPFLLYPLLVLLFLIFLLLVLLKVFVLPPQRPSAVLSERWASPASLRKDGQAQQ